LIQRFPKLSANQSIVTSAPQILSPDQARFRRLRPVKETGRSMAE